MRTGAASKVGSVSNLVSKAHCGEERCLCYCWCLADEILHFVDALGRRHTGMFVLSSVGGHFNLLVWRGPSCSCFPASDLYIVFHSTSSIVFDTCNALATFSASSTNLFSTVCCCFKTLCMVWFGVLSCTDLSVFRFMLYFADMLVFAILLSSAALCRFGYFGMVAFPAWLFVQYVTTLYVSDLWP